MRRGPGLPMLRVLVTWWRSDFDFRWIPEFLDRRSLALPLRWVIGLTCVMLGLCTGLLLASDQGPQTAAGNWALAIVGSSAVYAGVRWPMRPWPTEPRSLVFLVWADGALTAVLLFGIHDPVTAVPACGIFFVSGLYATLLHSPRVVVVHVAFAMSVAGLVVVRAVRTPGADVPFLLAESVIGCGVVVFPVALHGALQLLKHDAATSHHDPLTELLNRRGMADNIDRVLDGRGRLLVTLVLDLDGFKELNDERGHDAGDVALRGLATRLTSAAPAGGLVGRLGGDEFAVLFATSEADLPNSIELLRAAPSDANSGLSASVGVWIQPRPNAAEAGELFHDVVKRADFAMYEAKRAGVGLVVHRA